MNCVKGEIHNVLSMMRVNARWASADRFKQEIPAATQSPLMRALKQLHAELQWVTDLSDVDTVTYLLPFLLVIESDKTSGFITGAAISSLNKFLLYGLITSDSLRADVAINRIAVCVARCRFEETHRADDEAVLMKLLELVEYCLRCDAGYLITGDNVWKMIQLCYSISTQPRSSLHLCRAAENTLAHVILTVFDRIDHLERPTSSTPKTTNANANANATTATTTATKTTDKRRISRAKQGYGVSLLEQILQFVSGLISPANKVDNTCILGLRLINIVLETAGTSLSHHPRLVSVLQGDLSKYLLQNSETEDLSILSLTLRVVFNLFNSIKDHLKVQLEVFFTSVHMRIIDSPSCSDEQKELALESLLEFCREPAMMLDLYINYDCDVHCTNLFEVLCKSLAKNCQAREGANGSLNALTLLCLEGLLAVIESIARRCPLGATPDPATKSIASLQGADLARATSHQPPSPQLQRTASSDLQLDDISPLSSVKDLMQLVMSSSDSDSDADDLLVGAAGDGPHRPHAHKTGDTQLAWLHVARERTAEVLQQRKRTKKRYALAAEKFNAGQKTWLSYAQELELLPETLTPEAVAAFLLQTPGLNKTLIGDYLGEGPPEKYPFNEAVRDAYLSLLDFRSSPSLDEGLRVFLAKFRLPGEAQKIDRMMEAFSKEFFTQCGAAGPLADATAAFVLAFSIIMLNTDLHSDHVAKKMSVDEYIRNLRGINGGQDLPPEYIRTIYNNIKEREIQMQPDVGDLNDQNVVDRYSTQWDGVLKRSENVVGASFTSNSSILKLRAGLYEKEMFLLICDATIACISLAFDKSCDHANLERALDGLNNCANIALYYDMNELFNKIMGSLSTYFLAFAHGILNGEKIFVPPSATAKAAAAAITPPRAPPTSRGRVLSSGSSMSGEETQRTDEIEEEDEDEEYEDEDEVPSVSILSPQSKAIMSNSQAEDGLRGAKLRRALLSLKLLFQFVSTRHEAFRKAWASVVECVLMFNELDVVPTSLVEMDEFVDARGVPLPPIHNGGGSSSPKGVAGMATGVAGKTRERSRRMAERQAAIRSRIKTGVHSTAGGSSSTIGGSGGGPPTSSGSSSSIWDSLSSYLWADDDRVVDENFALVSKLLREEVAKLGGGVLEKENWLRLERKLSPTSLASLLDTLLNIRDPFKGLLLHADGSSDPMLQENAILVLELSVDLLLVNAHRIVSLNLWSKFHAYATKILQTPLRELHPQLHGLAERVVVHVLRVCVRLFHDATVRSQLMATLQLLLAMDDGMYQALSDRMALGINMLLKANVVYLNEFDGWDVLMALLENVVQYKAARAACWDSVKLLADGGHVGPHNVTLWMATCLRFVNQRTPFAVDALRLLQSLNLNMDDGKVWLEVMRVMLSYLHDDRAPIAKTAWECLYNALLLPGVAVAKDTWRLCFYDVIFPFDDQVNEGVWRHAKDAALHSVTLLAKTFLHHLSVLLELDDFNTLWLEVLRRLAHKLRTAGPLAASSTQAATVFETTLQSLYNLLLILQAENVLERECVITVHTEDGGVGTRMGTLFEATYAVVDEVVPHMKEQLGLVPLPVEAEPAQEEKEGTLVEEGEPVVPSPDGQVASVEPEEDRREDPSSSSATSSSSVGASPASTGRVLETIVIADGTIGVKVDEIIIDEITEAV